MAEINYSITTAMAKRLAVVIPYRPSCHPSAAALLVFQRRREALTVGVRELDELHADVEARGSAGKKRHEPHHLDAAGDLALVGEKQLQLQAITHVVRFVGEEAHASVADVDRPAPAEKRLASRTAQDRGLQARELAAVVGHAVELSLERPRRRTDGG